MSPIPQLIIGAGPAGLAVAGRMRKLNMPFEIIEQESTVAPAWHQHYDRLHLHTVKSLSALPHLPFPAHYPTYIPRQLLVDYYEDYAQRFEIKPYFNTSVSKILKEKEGWRVETTKGKSFHALRVIIATGVNREIFRPSWLGEESFKGTIIHSRAYKNALPYVGQRVMVVGMGNTGAEIALELSEQDIACYLSVRSPVNIVPRDFAGRPTQLTALKLARLPNWLNDWLGIQVRRLSFGNLAAHGIQTPRISPTRQLRELGKTPVIDLGTVAQIKAGKIKVTGAIDHFYPEGVVFKDGKKLALDTVILATGYRAKVSDFLPAIDSFNDKMGLPKQIIGEGDFAGLYFIGYDNYRPGGILGIIREDSAKIVEAIQKKC